MEADGTTKVKRKKRSKVVADVLVDQLVDLKDAIGPVTLKDSKFKQEYALDRRLGATRADLGAFGAFSSKVPCTRLVVSRSSYSPLCRTSTHLGRISFIFKEFYPYFRTEADAKVAFAQFNKEGAF